MVETKKNMVHIGIYVAEWTWIGIAACAREAK